MLNKAEGDGDKLAFAFESHRDKYEKERKKNDKLTRIIERLMDDDVMSTSDKVSVLLRAME